MTYHSGLLLGILCGVLVGCLIIALLFRKGVLDLHFDERQELARGKAFQYGFFTLMISLYLYSVAELAVGRWCDTLAGVTLCMALSLGVFAATCIYKDAYLSLREKPRQVITMFAVLTVVNLAFGAMYLFSGDLIKNGILTYRAVNPIVGLLTLFILVVYVIHSFQWRNGERE